MVKRMVIRTVAGFWLFGFGVYPLSEPSHSTLFDPWTWLDYAVHGYGFWLMVKTLWVGITTEPNHG